MNTNLPAWSTTGPDCKAFKALGMKATFYNDSDMLAAFPLLTHKKAHSTAPPPIPGAQLDSSVMQTQQGGSHSSSTPVLSAALCRMIVCSTILSVLAAEVHIIPYVSSRQPMLNMSTA
jgi:hypothetical protein